MGYAIQVVDDDPIQRELLAHYLGLAGFEVREDTDGAQALQRMEASPPDLVLLDVQMPEMDGFEVLQRMRGSQRTRDIPVLLVSSIDRSHVKVRGLELGADDYITKGCSQPELLARVRAGLRRAARYKQLQHSLIGEVEDIGLDTLLHTMQIGGKTVRIRFADVGGEVDVRQGAIRSCSFLRFTGAEALQRLFLVARGRFAADFELGSSGAAVDPSLGAMHVLMDSLVAVDEVRRALDEPLSKNPVVGAGPSGCEALGRVGESLPMSTFELVVTLDGDIRKNAELVADALRRGEIRIVD